MYDIEITIHRSGSDGVFELRVETPESAAKLIRDYLAGTWGIVVPESVDQEVVRQLAYRGEYRRDHEQYRVIVKPGPGARPGVN